MAVLGLAKPGMFMSDEEQRLFESVAQNNLTTVRKLVQQGININAQDARGRTALLVAVEEHHLKVPKCYLKQAQM